METDFQTKIGYIENIFCSQANKHIYIYKKYN